MEGAGEVRFDHVAPLVVGHAARQAVLGDAGRVDEDVDLLPLADQAVNDFLGPLGVADVGLQGTDLSALGRQFGGQGVGGLLGGVVQKGDFRPLGRQPGHAGPPNAAAAAGDDRCLAFKSHNLSSLQTAKGTTGGPG